MNDERFNDPAAPERARLDPQGRPIEDPVLMGAPPVAVRSGGSGWFIAGIIVVLLIIGGLFYANMGGTATDTKSPQTAAQQTTAPTDSTTTGSTTPNTTAPKAANPATPPAANTNSAAPAGNAAPGGAADGK